MKACEIHEHFRRLGTWVDWSDSVDGVHFGDPQTEVRRIAVAWKPYWSALRQAVDLGCNFFLTHEPIFREGRVGDETASALPREQGKLAWLQDSGLVVYRCHDVWDLIPEVGVRDSWAQGLGFSGAPLRAEGYLRLEDVTGHTVGSLARHVAARLRTAGQPGLLLVGDEDQSVTRLALGTGAAINLEAMLALEPDVCVLCDDYFRFVRDGALLQDLEVPFLVANHGALEEWGIANLARHAEAAFPSVPVHFLPQGCAYRFITAEGSMP
jgi:putative NIF3 family GTP cyclohydrolase 1 type 2